MDYLHAEDLDWIAWVDEKTNAVTIKFIGIPNNHSAQLFVNYVMVTLGIDYLPLEHNGKSKMIH